jgi:membrane-anchored protein YejM (alkaline phosphatase superfamily)
VAGASASSLATWNQAGFMVDQFAPYREFPLPKSYQRDLEMVRWAKEFHQQHLDSPQFLFLFFDSTHHAYSYPPEFEKYRPAGAEDALHVLRDQYLLPFRVEVTNRYRNSVGFVDHLLGELLAAFGDDVVLVVTGDHGEELWDTGLYGHSAARFDNARVRVPLGLCLPGLPPRVLPVSGHADLLPTVIDHLGPAPAVATQRYSDGATLLGGPLPYHVITGAGFPLTERRVCLVTETAKLWLVADAQWLGHFTLERATNLDDGPPPAGTARLVAPLIADFNRRFGTFLRW